MGRVPKTSRMEYTTPKKARFRALVESAGWSQTRAAHEVGISQPTGSRWLKETQERCTGRPGRPRKLDDSTFKKISDWFTGYYKHRVQSLQDIINHFELDCTPST